MVHGHSGVALALADGGADGAAPWLDLGRGSWAMIRREADDTLGAAVRQEVQPWREDPFDG